MRLGRCPSLHLIELRVDEHPATLGRVPIFLNPMVFKPARVEVCTEAAARTGRHALFAQERGNETREVPAYTGHARLWRAGLTQRFRAAPLDFLDHPGNTTDVRKVAVDQYALSDLAQ